MTLDTLRQYLVDLDHEESLLFTSPNYTSAVVGISNDGRVCYSYSRMIEHLMSEGGGMTYEDAVDFIDYNTIGALPPYKDKAPIIIYDLDL